jgi:hypothetical protein
LQTRNELLGVLGLVQSLVEGYAVRVEVRRQIFIGIAVAVGALDPNFLAAQALAQHLQDADLVVDAIYTCPILAVLNQDLPELSGHDTIDRDLSTGDQLTAIVAAHAQPGQGLDHRAMGAVVGAKSQGSQD